MTYEEMKQLISMLDKFGIFYEFGNYYGKEYPNGDGYPEEYICGHWLKINQQIFETDEIDDEDDRWNRG